jgi:hypothetical protein
LCIPCLWQTMQLLNARCRLGMGRELQSLKYLQLSLAKRRGARQQISATSVSCQY